MGLIEILPIVLTIVEVAKRFVPKLLRKRVNPIIALVVGLLTAFVTQGEAGFFGAVFAGVGGAAGAIATYKVPKLLGRKAGTEPEKEGG